jgi:hypothetical protein
MASSALLKMVYSSLAAGVGVAVVFSIAVFGVIRSGDMRRVNRVGAAAGFATLAGVALLACAAAVVYGLIVAAHKG